MGRHFTVVAVARLGEILGTSSWWNTLRSCRCVRRRLPAPSRSLAAVS